MNFLVQGGQFSLLVSNSFFQPFPLFMVPVGINAMFPLFELMALLIQPGFVAFFLLVCTRFDAAHYLFSSGCQCVAFSLPICFNGLSTHLPVFFQLGNVPIQLGHLLISSN